MASATGLTDEAVVEGHDFIEHAEADAGVRTRDPRPWLITL